MATEQQSDERMWTLAIIQALMTWTDPFYRPFLCGQSTPLIDSEWFEYFLKDWKVGRTISAKKRKSILGFFENDFHMLLDCANKPKAIDEAADHFQSERWGSKKEGKGSRPISIISKVGFFLHPNELIPCDRYAKVGLRKLNLKPDDNYQVYIESFNQAFQERLSYLEDMLKSLWVSQVTSSLGCPEAALCTAAFKRKVFDNYLMHSGGYKNKPANDKTQD